MKILLHEYSHFNKYIKKLSRTLITQLHNVLMSNMFICITGMYKNVIEKSLAKNLQ